MAEVHTDRAMNHKAAEPPLYECQQWLFAVSSLTGRGLDHPTHLHQRRVPLQITNAEVEAAEEEEEEEGEEEQPQVPSASVAAAAAIQAVSPPGPAAGPSASPPAPSPESSAEVDEVDEDEALVAASSDDDDNNTGFTATQPTSAGVVAGHGLKASPLQAEMSPTAAPSTLPASQQLTPGMSEVVRRPAAVQAHVDEAQREAVAAGDDVEVAAHALSILSIASTDSEDEHEPAAVSTDFPSPLPPPTLAAATRPDTAAAAGSHHSPLPPSPGAEDIKPAGGHSPTLLPAQAAVADVASREPHQEPAQPDTLPALTTEQSSLAVGLEPSDTSSSLPGLEGPRVSALDDYSMSFDGLEADLEVDASALSPKPASATEVVAEPPAVQTTGPLDRAQAVAQYVEREVDHALADSVEVIVSVAGGVHALPGTQAAASVRQPALPAPDSPLATSPVSPGLDSPPPSSPAWLATTLRRGSLPLNSADSDESSSSSSSSEKYTQDDLRWQEDDLESPSTPLAFNPNSYVVPPVPPPAPVEEAPLPPTVDMSQQAVASYVGGVVQSWLADTQVLPEFLEVGREPLSLHMFLALERQIEGVSDEQHIANKLLYDAANEALLGIYRAAGRIKDPLVFRPRRPIRPLPSPAALVAAVQQQVQAWSSTVVRDRADLDKLLAQEANEEERSWAACLDEAEASVCTQLVDMVWDDLLEDGARCLLELEQRIAARRALALVPRAASAGLGSPGRAALGRLSLTPVGQAALPPAPLRPRLGV
ncbi:hypothetical protein V8C86DRAFT_298973 [Haematococcus lacustris]